MPPETIRDATLAFNDTLACIAAGWDEPVTQKLLSLYARGDAAGGVKLLDGRSVAAAETAALIWATSGHALDYDDVHLTSVTHPSVVMIPVLMALVAEHPAAAARAASALAVGTGVNIALGQVLGYDHYDKGWHATSTIGGIAAAAAAAHLLQLSPDVSRHAIGLAAAQACGLQRNFGSMTKPLHAGFAAAAAVRAIQLADAGVTASPDIFGDKGFFDLYGGPNGYNSPDNIRIRPDLSSLSRKLFPCCYQTHRIIAAGLAARAQLADTPDASTRIELEVPFGTMRPLHVLAPRTGLEAKFCAAYALAVALHQGHVGLADFEDDAVLRPEIRRLMAQIDIREDELKGEIPVGIEHGSVRLTLRRDNHQLAYADIAPFPGSPADPATDAQIEAKVADCLARYNRGRTAPLGREDFTSLVQTFLPAAL
ncbi:MmgE/PrpD family protein [Falsigemmobacter intermedius]|uniref:MmgE/PrpD family protein n=1 Tax=Falsigemmobacter intermedius TaxID=1553448 RepID=UPI003F08FC11